MYRSILSRIDAIQNAETPQERKIGVARLSTIIVGLFALAFSLFHLVLGDTSGAMLLAVIAAAATLLSRQAERMGCITTSNLLALLMAIVLSYFQLGLDGIHAPHTAWFALLPIIALLGDGRRSVIFWLAFSIMFQVFVFIEFRHGIGVEASWLPQLSDGDRDVDTLFVHLGQILALCLIVWAVEAAREAAFSRVQGQREELAELNKTLEQRIEEEVKARISAELAHEHEIENTQKEVIMTMGTICEGRSRETANHVRRVAEYSALLARLSGLPVAEEEILRIASPMHDIGKVAIPDAILNKPGRLTDEEYAHMQEHASLGYEMLSGSSRPIIQAAAIIAHQHHEKYDGSGYPNRLAGEEIHIYGRITALADVFDALGSDRVYKKAWPLEKVLEFIREQRGKHFDPQLVKLLFEELDEFLAIREKYRDVV